MNTDKHGLKKVLRQAPSRAWALSLPPEPKLTKSEKTGIERAWTVEIRRRVAAFNAGKMTCRPAADVMKDAYDRLSQLSNSKRQKAF
jgi:hypothetical protein